MLLGYYYLLVYILLCFQLNYAPIIFVYNAHSSHFMTNVRQINI
jgi:hypothetical protein